MKTKTVYTADDGKEFDSVEACRNHEQTVQFGMLVGLTNERLTALLAGKEPKLAAAIERLGRKLAEDRIAGGGSLRKRAAVAPAKTNAA